MVGEIRDVQTAQIATQAALTGHIVLASLHTNSALQALIRLVEMGVESFLVAPALIGVLGQRLVRRICPRCKEPAGNQQALWTALGFPEGPYPPTWQGRGCNHCYGTGYHGRLPIHELLVLSDPMRHLIMQGTFTEQAIGLAEAEGFKPMRLDGIKKALRGLTTLEEVFRQSGGG